jgi:integrase
VRATPSQTRRLPAVAGRAAGRYQALFLGLRSGELLGLRFVHVDLDRTQLEIVQTLGGPAAQCGSLRDLDQEAGTRSPERAGLRHPAAGR